MGPRVPREPRARRSGRSERSWPAGPIPGWRTWLLGHLIHRRQLSSGPGCMADSCHWCHLPSSAEGRPSGRVGEAAGSGAVVLRGGLVGRGGDDLLGEPACNAVGVSRGQGQDEVSKAGADRRAGGAAGGGARTAQLDRASPSSRDSAQITRSIVPPVSHDQPDAPLPRGRSSLPARLTGHEHLYRKVVQQVADLRLPLPSGQERGAADLVARGWAVWSLATAGRGRGRRLAGHAGGRRCRLDALAGRRGRRNRGEPVERLPVPAGRALPSGVSGGPGTDPPGLMM